MQDGVLVKRQIGQLAAHVSRDEDDEEKDIKAIEEGEAAARRVIEEDTEAKDMPAAAKREATTLRATPSSKRKGDKLQPDSAKKPTPST